MGNHALPLRWAGAAYAALFILAVVAFWPGYIAAPKAGLSAWTHLHAATATLWLVMLIAQPLAIRAGRRDIHRLVGRSSLVLMPILLASFVGLSHSAMQGMTPPELGIQAYFFYIRAVLVTLFTAAYVMGMLHRHNAALHARYMVCTGLSLIDPVVHRLAFRFMADQDFNYQLITFGLVYLVLATLIWMERHARAGRHVFPAMLAGFLAGGLPLLLDFHTWGAPWEAWKSVTAAFAALPIP